MTGPYLNEILHAGKVLQRVKHLRRPDLFGTGHPGGRIEQVGTPLELYEDPDNAFVAGFIGSPRMNFLTASASGAGRLALGGTEIVTPVALAAGTDLQFGIRPERLDDETGVVLPLKVEVVEQLGSTAYVHGTLANGDVLVAERRRDRPRPGDTIDLRFDPARVRLFDGHGQRLR